MDHGLNVLRSHPQTPPKGVEDCIKACLDCLLACTVCADACLGEREAASLATCIRLDNDCAAVCAATVQLLARSGTGVGVTTLRAQLTACAVACKACEAECRKHEAHHRHCAHCAGACKTCREACEATLKALN